MKILSIILSITVLCCLHKTNEKYFPKKTEVLTTDFIEFDNFFPIVTLDLSNKGIKDKIHVIYVSFDPDINHYEPFPEGDDIDNFSFEITEDGLYNPTFDKSSLIIGDGFMKHFIKENEKFEKSKGNDMSLFLNFSSRPVWWQEDQTPKNSNGVNMKFICQADIYNLFNDDCRLFVFYDETDRKVEYVYQRT